MRHASCLCAHVCARVHSLAGETSRGVCGASRVSMISCFVVSDAAADRMTDEPSAGKRHSEPPWQGRRDGQTATQGAPMITHPWRRKALLTAEGREQSS